MPKFTLFQLCVMAASLCIVSAVTEEELKAFRKSIGPYIEECSNEYGVSGDDIQAAKDNKNANAVKPCFIECVLRRTEILDTSGYYNADRGLYKLRKFVKDKEDFAKFEVVAKKCMKEYLRACGACRVTPGQVPGVKVNDIPVSKDETQCDRAMFLLECAFNNLAQMPLKK